MNGSKHSSVITRHSSLKETNILNFINGEFEEPSTKEYIENIDPARGEVYGRIPDSDERDIQAAVNAASSAFDGWSTTSAEERCRRLMAVAQGIEDRLEAFARAESIDSGKPLTLARTVDIPRAVSNFRFFATACMHMASESHAVKRVAVNYTLRYPLGVVGLISPWNLPLYLLSWKIAPALAAGNTAVAKPSEVTPVTGAMLAEVCREAGLPKGVLNIVHGYGHRAGAALIRHPAIQAISFTGGTKTGAEIARTASPLFKKLSLELGGKNPNIIFSDVDLDEVLEASLRSAFRNQGQICLAGSRIFVQEEIYRKFTDRFVASAKRLKVGDPLEPSTEQGAVVSQGHYDKILSYFDVAREEGGTIRCGGRAAGKVNERCRGGYFVEPTVITDLDVECRTNQEEIFGPVVTITPFRREEEVVRYANSTVYGLAASIWTNDIRRAHRLAERVQCGTIWVNCWMERDLRVPFGGMKQSGVGREGGEEALRFFTEPKNVCIKL